MNDIPILNLIPEKYRGYVLLLIALAPVLGRAYHAITSGGGLRGIWTALIFGTNTPKAADPAAAVQDGASQPQRPASGFAVWQWLLVVAVASGVILTIAGCNTTQQKAAYNTLYSLEQTTTAAVDSYDTLVLQGKVPTNGVPAVSRAYNDFQAAFRVALDAVQFNTNAIAPPNLVVESQDVINLITTLKGKATP